MVLFKKALSLYQQTAALLVVFALLTAALFYIIFGPRDDGQLAQQISQIAQIEVELPQDNPGPVVIEQDSLASVEAGGCDSTSAGLTTEEKSLIGMINNYRQQNGLSALEISGLLNNMAANLAEDMNAHNYLGHVDSQGRNLATRFSDCVPNLGGTGYENAAMAPTAQQVFNGWKASSGHNANMLSSDSRAMGIARSGNYWDNVFASRNPGGQVVDDNTQPTATKTPTATRTPTATGPTNTPTVTPTNLPNNPTATLTPSPTLAVGDTFLTITIELPGIGPNSSAGENGNPIRHKVGELASIDKNSGQVINVELDFGYSADIFVATTHAFPPGIYEMKLRLDNTLWKNLGLAEVLRSEYSYTRTAILVTGDMNQDNELSILDYSALISCYGARTCSQKNQADFNLDGKVDEVDLNIFYSGLAKRMGD